ncbi:uncharacterized protein LOC100551679 isoform X2 [Anolis carolinensis]|uniref:uncharacterized protein LOC100551679 isoform X2 n=1 Tax=Anolis carolinensis TaxID=28377 RepID=UPI000462B255|nr:PREDICTED: uncharacterized protein LOC100551679 isoform X2 [Anolis carolinensis]|eukprot:XP_008111165.1 PREDICTED: uncharacterized protein LOC100551679 isoform X2 [Anolis carolinensis]
MEETPERQAEKPSNATPYYCNICKIYCASPVNLQTHFLGSKHKMVEKALKSHGIVKPLSGTTETVRTPEPLPNYVDTEPKKPSEKTLEEQLNSCKDEEPAIGLQYITEYQSKENLVYECNLCSCQTGLTNMFMHVLGVKHKLAYLKKHRPELADVTGRGSNLKKKLKEIAAKVEQEEGRKHIMVSMDVPIMKEDKYSLQLSDSLVTWFAEDDVDIGNKKDNAKSSEEGTQKTGDINNSTKCDGSSKTEDEEQQDKQSFEIVDEYDASFILKVTQILTNSLVVYRQKVSERKNFSESNPEEKVDQSELSQMTSGTNDEPNIGFSEKQSPAQRSSKNIGTFNPQNKRKASPLSVNDKSKHFKHGSFTSALVDAPDEQASLGEMQYSPFFASDRNPSFPNMSEAPIGSLPGSSVSESHIIAEFLSSIRNMNADEVAATFNKTTASNPSFSGMDVQNVMKILTENGTLKSEKIASTT